jgi:cystathionine beta-lyase
MKYNFDEIINRKQTYSSKWDNVGARIGNPDAIPMWVADMDFRAPEPVIEALKKRAEHGVFGYPYLPMAFREATQRWLRDRHGWTIACEDVIFCSGIVPALYNIVQALTAPGDKILIQRPVYYPFTNAIEDNGRVVNSSALILREGKYEIDFDDFEAHAADPDTHLMILCNPHNPVGRVFTRDELSRIAHICLRHNVTILSDEVHSDFVFPGHRHVPTASLSPEIADITITAVAPSKTFNLAGLRSAALISANKELRMKLDRVLNDNRSASLTAFGLDAYIAAYTSGDEYIDQLLVYLGETVGYLDGYLKEHMPKIKLIQPEGTYLMWLDCRQLGLDDAALDHFFVQEAAVAVDKGHWFGSEGSGFMRLNIACPRATVTQALTQLQKVYGAHGF